MTQPDDYPDPPPWEYPGGWDPDEYWTEIDLDDRPRWRWRPVETVNLPEEDQT